tara:strand:- start:2497 stop:3147 length:651 start_codon:yes stop_codon:yes gene_type:complete
MNKYNYLIENFPFRDLLIKHLDVSSLNFIHREKDFNYDDKFERQNDQSTHYHKKFYELARTPDFLNMYNSFIREVVKPIFGEEVVYQKIPTFRLHFPGNIAVGEYHRDRNYRDPEWAKRVKEFNFFLPLTDAYDSNTIWVESKEGKEDFSPMNSEYGQVIKWDGSNLLHGNKLNEETTTRVSFDFRVMPLSRYEPSVNGSINTGTLFSLGEYYDKI